MSAGAIVLHPIKSAALWRLGRRRHWSRDKDGGHTIGSAMAETPYTSEIIAD